MMTVSIAKIRLADDCAYAPMDQQEERALDYDNPAAWAELAASRLAIIVPREATLEIGLPAMPHTEEALLTMLRNCAPLVPGDLVWTEPRPGASGGATVTVVRRDWLEARTIAVHRFLSTTDWAIYDLDGRRFVYPVNGRNARSHVAWTGLVAIVVAAVIIWNLERVSPRDPMPRQTAAVSTAPRTTLQSSAAPSQAPTVVSAGRTELVLLGIAGRLPDDADVLVKTPWGETATMRKGDSLLGWKLQSVASDRVVLEKEGLRDELVLEPLN